MNKAYPLASISKTKNMDFHFHPHKRKIKPFHLYTTIYALIMLAGLIYKFLKQ